MNMFDKAVFALPGAKRAFAVCIVCALARAGAAAGQAFFLADAVVGLCGGAYVADVTGEIAAFLACFIALAAIAWVQDAYISRFAARTACDLRGELLDAVFEQGPVTVARRGSSSVVNTIVQGADDVEEYLCLTLPKLAALMCVPTVLVMCAFAVDWVSGLIMLVALPVIVMFMVLIGYNAEDAAAKRYRQFGMLANHFVDSLQGLETLRAFGRAESHGEVVFEKSERFRETTMKTLRVAQLSGAVLDLASTLALAAVAIMLGFRMVEGSVAFSAALFILILTPEYFKPVREFAADYHATLDGRTALADVLEMAAEAGRGNAGDGGETGAARASSAPQGEAAHTTSPSATDRQAARSSSAHRHPAGHHPVLELAQVAVTHPPSTSPAIADVSLTLEPGMHLGVIGPSGSGKSTLVSLIAGFTEPSAGAIRLDGRDVPTLRTPAWQSRVLVIPQRPRLFHATLRENLCFYTPEATDADAERAIIAVGLDCLVSELEEGLDTVLGGGGRTLSGGEAQRVALARALLDTSRDVIVFDEPTAHLDIETECELKARMLEITTGRTVVFATHRLHWMSEMDAVCDLSVSGPSIARPTEKPSIARPDEKPPAERGVGS